MRCQAPRSSPFLSAPRGHRSRAHARRGAGAADYSVSGAVPRIGNSAMDGGERGADLDASASRRLRSARPLRGGPFPGACPAPMRAHHDGANFPRMRGHGRLLIAPSRTAIHRVAGPEAGKRDAGRRRDLIRNRSRFARGARAPAELASSHRSDREIAGYRAKKKKLRRVSPPATS